MTAFTPLFGIEFLVQGEPAYLTRAVLQRNAETLEAALARGGVAPPNATDAVTLQSRVAHLITGPVSAYVAATGPATAANGSTSGLHAATTITRPFGVGVPFRGEVTAQIVVSVAAGTTTILNAAGLYSAGAHADYNVEPAARQLCLKAPPQTIDSGTADTLAYQPILQVTTGSISASVLDPRMSFSFWKVWPKA